MPFRAGTASRWYHVLYVCLHIADAHLRLPSDHAIMKGPLCMRMSRPMVPALESVVAGSVS